MKIVHILAIAAIFFSLASCSGSNLDDVSRAIENRSTLNGKIVKVKGRLKYDSGYLNIYSNRKDICLGLLLTESQIAEYRRFANRQVLLTGQLRSEGCGRESVCVEALCGPAVLADVSLDELE